MDLNDLAARRGLTPQQVEISLERAKRSMVRVSRSFTVLQRGQERTINVMREGVGPLDTEFGHFHHLSFQVSDRWQKYSVVLMAQLTEDFCPDFTGRNKVLLRIDSGCETGQLFGDRTCECREQLNKGLRAIRDEGAGLLISIPRQDGRGLGLPFKLATLALQKELQVDTVEASKMLDPDGSRDTRTYTGVIAILKFLRIPSSMPLQVATNNPHKLRLFEENGFPAERQAIVVPPTQLTLRHLRAKQDELGHYKLIDDGVGSDDSDS